MGISVVIPVKERVNYLEKALKSIAEAKKLTFNQIEVIVVDDSHEETRSKIEEICKRFHASYHYVQKGVSEKRNYGIKHAKFSVVLFVDSDCEVGRNIFNEHQKCYNSKEVDGCAGVTEFVGKRTRLWNIIEKMPFSYPFQWAKSKSYVPWAPCTNISFRKEVLERVNGFRTILPPKEAGEDVDLGYRVTSLGYKICCNATAKVYHTRETWANLIQFIERTFRFGRGEYYLMKNHPEKIFLDPTKTILLFIILLMFFIYRAVVSNTLLYTVVPLAWLLVAILLQAILALKYRIIKDKWRNLSYIYLSLLFETLFEFGTIVECVKKRNLKLSFYRFIYIDDQLSGRWYRNIIKTWSLIISFCALFILLILFK